MQLLRGAGRLISRRTVIHGDALRWLRENPAQPGCSLLTSLPDVSELGTPHPEWEAFYRQAARCCLQAVSPAGMCGFFQTDTRGEAGWISKGGMLLQEAAALGVPLLWHKIVLRKPPDTVSRRRAGYSHLLAFSQAATIPRGKATPDVLPDMGLVPWSHSMGTRAAERFLRDVRRFAPQTHTVLNPFCGIGTVLAVANAQGYHAVGVERNRRRAEAARSMSMATVRLRAAPDGE